MLNIVFVYINFSTDFNIIRNIHIKIRDLSRSQKSQNLSPT